MSDPAVRAAWRALPMALLVALGACKAGPVPSSTTPSAEGAGADLLPGEQTAAANAANATTDDVQPFRPTDGPPPTAIPAHVVSAAGVSVAIPDSLGATVEAIEVPAVLDGAQPLASGVQLTLKDYPVKRDRPATIVIRHGPLDAEAGRRVMPRYHEMVNFIGRRDKNISYVPIFAEPSVREQFVSQLRFRSMDRGAGLGARFLTQFGGESRPINNLELVYVLEGLHHDSAAWLSIYAPVTVNDPAIAADATPADPKAFAAGYYDYLAATIKRLNELPSDAFTPNLDHLDSIVATLHLDWPTPSPDDIRTAQAIDE